MMQTEKWHVRGGGWIGQAIYGMNNGLGTAFGVVK
jgi:vacuolar iron transporter family protein